MADATTELAHAATRVWGERRHPVPDLAELAAWLERIAGAAGGRPGAADAGATTT